MVRTAVVFFLLVAALPSVIPAKTEKEVEAKPTPAPQKKTDKAGYFDFRELLGPVQSHVAIEAPAAIHHPFIVAPPPPPLKRFATEVEDVMRSLQDLLDKMTFAMDKLLDATRIHYY